MKIFACFLIAILFVFSVARATDPPIKYIGIEHGLSNNAVTSIYQDKSGFLWFGTYDGLNKHTGYGIQVFRNRIGDSTTLPNNNVYAIDGDAMNRIWVGTEKGASVYFPAKNEFYPLSFYTTNQQAAAVLRVGIHCFKAISGGHMLVGSSKYGLLDYSAALQPAHPIPLEGAAKEFNYMVSAIEYDNRTNTTWVFVPQRGLYAYDAKAGTLKLLNDQIRQAKTLVYDGEGTLWLGNPDGLFRYLPASNQYEANVFTHNTNIAHLNIDHNGLLWIGTDGGGLWTLDRTSPAATPYLSNRQNSVINSNSIFAVYEDRQHRTWIGTLRGGINMIDSRTSPFQLILPNKPDKTNPAQNFILALCADKQQNIWIGTDGAGLRYWDRQKQEFEEFIYRPDQPTGISSNFITSIIEDAQNEVWISTWFGGINRMNRVTGTIKRYSCYNPVTHASDAHSWIVFEDSQKRLWASTTNDGCLYLFNRKLDRFELFDAGVQNLQALYEDQQGNLWGGNYSELIQIDRIGKQHRHFPIGTTVRAIYRDKANRLWLGTQGGGLLLFNTANGTYTRYTADNGLPSNSILRILEDDAGKLWLTTFNGLSKFDPETTTAQNFTQSDGLQSNQFSFNAGIRLNNGEMMVGGIKGLNVFHPDSVRFSNAAPPVFLSGVSISNKSDAESRAFITRHTPDQIRQMTVPFDLANVHFEFLALDYSLPDKIQYAYMLEGWDKEWNYSHEQRAATYMRLQEGNYQFKVKVADSDGKWGEPVTLSSLVILPPWYRTGWAYLLYLLGAIGLIIGYSVYAARQARLVYEVKLANLENQREKELHERKLNVYTHVSHEFRTPLTLIINPIKELLHDKKMMESHQEIGTVYRNARRLLSLVDQLLHFRKADSGTDQLRLSDCNMHELCADIFQCFVHEARVHQIDYQMVDNLASKPYTLSVDREKMEMALFNLLSNAFKYTPEGGKIRLELSELNGYLQIGVQDSGPGIAPEQQQKIFEHFQQAGENTSKRTSGFGIGLFLVHHFISLHKGNITCSSRPGKGSTFIMALPGKTAAAPAAVNPAAETGPRKEWMQHDSELEAPVVKPDTAVPSTVDSIITHKKLVLVIDDNPEITQYLQTALTKKYSVITAANGTTGYQVANDRLPDLILCDINMEDMNGLEICHRLKSSTHTNHIPLILLTAEAASEMQVKGMEGGADDYITKPFELDVLLVRMEALLRSRSQLHQYFFEAVTLKTNTTKVPAEYQQFLQKCIEVIEQNIDNESFTTKMFAQQVGLSQSGLYQKIKTISGQSLNSFIRTIRLRRAAVLMLTENMNVSQAGFQVGFSDSRYFREQFVRLFGMNPSDYIKKYRETFNSNHNLLIYPR